MKFLCVSCDESMSLLETRGPDDGSMTVVFGCPSCGRRTAMLTNAMETQVVRSLGVDLKPKSDGASSGSKCPFTGVVSDAFADNELGWTEAARARAERIPVFARSMAMKGVEDYARRQGYREVSEAVLDEARGHLGL